MKCQICGKETRNTIGGCYICDECGFGINGLVYRDGKDWTVNALHEYMQEEILETLNAKQNTATTTTEGLTTSSNAGKATIPDWSNHGWVRQGWQCPKCGAILSPNTPFCPFCSRQTFTPTFTCGTSGEYVNPNVSTSISKEQK